MCLIYARHSSESFKYLFIKSVHLHNNTVIIIPLASPVAQLVKNLPAMQETPVQFLGQEDPPRRDRLPTPVFLGFLGSLDSNESACNTGDLGSIPGSNLRSDHFLSSVCLISILFFRFLLAYSCFAMLC